MLQSFLADPATWRYGYDIAKETGLRSGTLYPILARLADGGQLDRRWESDPVPGRPPRHLYRLTDSGLVLAKQAVVANAARVSTAAEADPRFATRPAMGM